jgi:hypothetical protein
MKKHSEAGAKRVLALLLPRSSPRVAERVICTRIMRMHTHRRERNGGANLRSHVKSPAGTI